MVSIATSSVSKIKQVQDNFPPSHCQMRETIILVERKILSEKRTSAENRTSHDLLGTTRTSEPATIPTSNALALVFEFVRKVRFFFGATCKTTLNNAFRARKTIDTVFLFLQRTKPQAVNGPIPRIRIICQSS